MTSTYFIFFITYFETIFKIEVKFGIYIKIDHRHATMKSIGPTFKIKMAQSPLRCHKYSPLMYVNNFIRIGVKILDKSELFTY